MATPDAGPVGANDWTCTPTPAHPRPVILVHGTWENAYNNWSGLAPVLKNDGYCVYALNYGRSSLAAGGGAGALIPGANGTAPIEDSARQLAGFVEQVRARTGAEQVDLVGHSQGGLVIRQYLKFGGGTDSALPAQNTVNTVVTLGTTNHGTTLGGIGTLGREIGKLVGLDRLVGISGIQQVHGSPFLRTLNREGDTLPGVRYTVIATRYDEVTTPYESTFLTAGPDATVDNITLQDGCPADTSGHLSMSYSPRAIDWARHALDPTGFPADQVRCTPHA